MKKLSYGIGVALLACIFPLFSHAANYITELTPNVVSNQTYTANFKVTTAPNSVIKVYSHFAEYGTNNWNNNVAVGPLINISSSSLNATFSADFAFGPLGVVSGKKYKYYLADSGSTAGNALTPVQCFDITGTVPCGSPQVLDSSSFVVTQVSQGIDTGHPGKYLVNASIAPSVTLTSAVTVTLKIVNDATNQQIKSIDYNLPAGGGTTFPTIEDFAPGAYTVTLYAGTTAVSNPTGWHVVMGANGGPKATFTYNGLPSATCDSQLSICEFHIMINVTVPGSLKFELYGYPFTAFDGHPKVNGSLLKAEPDYTFYNAGSSQASIELSYNELSTFLNSAGDSKFWFKFNETQNQLVSDIGSLLDGTAEGIISTTTNTNTGNTGGINFNNGNNANVNGVTGVCGSAYNQTFPILTSESANLCQSGTVQQFNYSGTAWTWNCIGSSGVPVGCNATQSADQNYGDGFLKNPLAAGLDTFPKIFAAVYNNIILPVAIPFIVLSLMYVGFKFVVARKTGNSDGYADAKRILKYTLIGTALLLGGWVIANALQGTLNSLAGTAPVAQTVVHNTQA
jgi:hypothetical protein